MAKSTAEQLRDLALEVRAPRERDEYQDREITRLRDDLSRDREGRAELERENAALKQQLQDHVKHTELSDARRWAFILAFVSALLALASGLIVALVRK